MKTQKSIPLWTVHVIPDVLSEVGIQPIWLPPHSSHFLQVLDLLVFVELKRLTEPEEQGRRVQNWRESFCAVFGMWQHIISPSLKPGRELELFH